MGAGAGIINWGGAVGGPKARWSSWHFTLFSLFLPFSLSPPRHPEGWGTAAGVELGRTQAQTKTTEE